mmetsp:Transcript_18622/g.52423  ORF Transcript_18622/g.52423 Transcript_18622/m.52423 type:complete len:204 (-) Transcript_18622:23-634(-)
MARGTRWAALAAAALAVGAAAGAKEGPGDTLWRLVTDLEQWAEDNYPLASDGNHTGGNATNATAPGGEEYVELEPMAMWEDPLDGGSGRRLQFHFWRRSFWQRKKEKKREALGGGAAGGAGGAGGLLPGLGALAGLGGLLGLGGGDSVAGFSAGLADNSTNVTGPGNFTDIGNFTESGNFTDNLTEAGDVASVQQALLLIDLI